VFGALYLVGAELLVFLLLGRASGACNDRGNPPRPATEQVIAVASRSTGVATLSRIRVELYGSVGAHSKLNSGCDARLNCEARSPHGSVWIAGRPNGGHAARSNREGEKLYGSIAAHSKLNSSCDARLNCEARILHGTVCARDRLTAVVQSDRIEKVRSFTAQLQRTASLTAAAMRD